MVITSGLIGCINMQKEKAKQGLPLLDFPAKDFLSFPNSIKRHCQNQLPVKKLVWKYASFLSLEIGPQRSDLFTSYFHLTADSRRFSPLPCEKILCSTDLWKEGVWYCSRLRCWENTDLGEWLKSNDGPFCFVLLFLQFPVRSWLTRQFSFQSVNY